MEENRKGPGIFYAVVGVATLVVAIVGATFAYFSASANATGDKIEGGTNDALATSLHVSVTEVYPASTDATVNHGLVPANITKANKNEMSAAISHQCIANGYTGCHLWKIVAGANQNIAASSIWLEELTTGASTKTDWHYTIFTGSDTAVSNIVRDGDFDLAAANRFDMHNGAALTGGTDVTYYLLVYITNNVSASQNDTTNGGTVQTGSYTGRVTMDAMGGKVSAQFSA